jgi:hypothetical protein
MPMADEAIPDLLTAKNHQPKGQYNHFITAANFSQVLEVVERAGLPLVSA